MELSKLLMPGAVRVVGQLTRKKRLFQELGEVAAQAYGLNAAVAIDGLQERESLGPTGVGHGIALPHARLEDLKRSSASFSGWKSRWIMTASTASRLIWSLRCSRPRIPGWII